MRHSVREGKPVLEMRVWFTALFLEHLYIIALEVKL